ncbi:hypothetical protein C8R47DRAFT_814359 [Mycena vitilis]|nr:hypothetical protein C8R47DRAFT_814359 [Mycena vitilis]
MAQRPALAHENFAFRLYIEAIMPHCRRWESLHLTVPFNDLPVICGEFPLLQSLVINMPDADEHAHAAPVHVFVEAPKLRGLLLLPMPSPTQIIFPWAQMSVMSIHTNFAQRLLTVLPLIVNVTDLTIKLQSFEAALTEDTPDIPPFPQLRALRLPGTDGFGSRTVTRLLQKLTLPSLCLLDADAISLPPRAIKALLSRSRCHRPSFKLAIRRSAFTEADYRKVLRKVGTIVVLEPADGDEATEESDGDVGEESEQSSNEDP